MHKPFLWKYKCLTTRLYGTITNCQQPKSENQEHYTVVSHFQSHYYLPAEIHKSSVSIRCILNWQNTSSLAGTLYKQFCIVIKWELVKHRIWNIGISSLDILQFIQSIAFIQYSFHSNSTAILMPGSREIFS